jgi:hypothetical protein
MTASCNLDFQRLGNRIYIEGCEGPVQRFEITAFQVQADKFHRVETMQKKNRMSRNLSRHVAYVTLFRVCGRTMEACRPLEAAVVRSNSIHHLDTICF